MKRKDADTNTDIDSIVFVTVASPALISDAKDLPVHMVSQDVPGADWLQACKHLISLHSIFYDSVSIRAGSALGASLGHTLMLEW